MRESFYAVARAVVFRDLLPAVVNRRRVPAFELQQVSVGENSFSVHLVMLRGNGGSFAL